MSGAGRAAHRPGPTLRRPAGARAVTLALAALVALVALLAGCASTPGGGGADGPPREVPRDLHRTPDAVPRIEPIRQGGPNKPYEVFGRRYVPFTDDRPFRERGLASWYGRKFHGRPTANGERYDMFAMTAAHKTMPLPSYAVVRNPANGREVVVRVNDRGPFADGRVIDLSYVAALKLGVLGGVAPVELRRLTAEDIRAGNWARSPAPDDTPAAAADDDPAPGTPPPPGWWVQLAAFRDGDAAAAMQRQVAELAVDDGAAAMAVRAGGGWWRVQRGPWPTREAAEAAARRWSTRLGVEAFVAFVPR